MKAWQYLLLAALSLISMLASQHLKSDQVRGLSSFQLQNQSQISELLGSKNDQLRYAGLRAVLLFSHDYDYVFDQLKDLYRKTRDIALRKQIYRDFRLYCSSFEFEKSFFVQVIKENSIEPFVNPEDSQDLFFCMNDFYNMLNNPASFRTIALRNDRLDSSFLRWNQFIQSEGDQADLTFLKSIVNRPESPRFESLFLLYLEFKLGIQSASQMGLEKKVGTYTNLRQLRISNICQKVWGHSCEAQE